MDAGPSSGITTILHELHAGDPDAQERLLNLVYSELRRMAAGLLNGERSSHTWQPSDLVHEALIRLLGSEALPLTENRQHFFGIVSRTMRRLLIEHARLRKARKREGQWQRVPLDDVMDFFERRHLDVLAMHEALERLDKLHSRQCQVVTLRYHFGFKVEEVAQQLGESVSTIESDWRLARAWLRSQLGGEPS
jgi:RNA polymerase sigma-70 factor, ECF subfamily